LLWERFLIRERRIPFTSLVDNKKIEDYNNKSSEISCDLKLEILARPQDENKLPTFHQQMLTLPKIDYERYFLVYAALEGKRPGAQIKVDEIIQRQDEVIIKLCYCSAQSECALEVIDAPYDIVKIDKSQLSLKDEMKFKFVANRQTLLKEISFCFN
jgi:hypothetical protein